MLLFDIEKSVRQKYSPKNEYFFASFNNDRGLSLDDKTKDYADTNSLHEVTQLEQYSGWKFAYLSGYFSKTKTYFHKKTTPQ